MMACAREMEDTDPTQSAADIGVLLNCVDDLDKKAGEL